jgi:8-oxo-dGTP pyrophosphatase MutT (NUDIX family)
LRCVYDLFINKLIVGLARRSVGPEHDHVIRQQYLDDPLAPLAQRLLPAAFAIVRNHRGQVLLVRRTDDGNWELPGGRIEAGESAATAVEREVAEEAGVAVHVVGLAGVYSDPRHVLSYPGEGTYQQIAICFHAEPLPGSGPRPDNREITAARWFDVGVTIGLPMHPTMRQRLTDAAEEAHARPHFD